MKPAIISLIVSFFFSFNLIQGQSSANDVGTTPGGISVSLTGAATYSVPLDLPPGIRDVAPSLALAFNGQGGNGLAGWGWNLSGLSTITRVPSTIHHDGAIDPVDFDNLDRYALDGQRLLVKTGSYGANGAVYQTENYSNIKIISYGTSPYGTAYGPSYFVVFYPDGSRAWYGNAGGSRGRLEWAIYKWQDPQGNFIQYGYSVSNNLLRVNKVSYGSRSGTSAPIAVNFYYKSRSRAESSYVANQFFKRTNILDRIEIYNSGSRIRTYKLGHDTSSLGYNRVTYIQESNGAGKVLEPIKFQYNGSTDAFNNLLNTSITSRSGSFTSEEQDRIAGDFNGDGSMDVITYDRSPKSEIEVFTDLHQGQNTNIYKGKYTLGTFNTLLTAPILVNNKFSDKTGVIKVSESFTSTGTTSSVRFTAYTYESSGMVQRYAKTWASPTYKYQSSCGSNYRLRTSKKYISGDFNGDGLGDVIALTYPYTEKFCNTVSCDGGGGGGGGDPQPIQQRNARVASAVPTRGGDGGSTCCECTSYPRTVSKSYFVDLDANKTSGYAGYSGQLRASLSSSDRIMSADFDGDGKSDLIHFKTGYIYVYSLDGSNVLRHITTLSDSQIKFDKPLISGDFNGDGKSDFATPVADQSSDWRFFLSKGTSVYAYTKNIGLIYSKPRISGGYRYEYHYVGQDFNSDGKSDILKHQARTSTSNTSYSYQLFELFANNTRTTSQPAFTRKTSKSYSIYNIRPYGIPVFMEGVSANGNIEYAYLSGKNVQIYKFERDNRMDTSLKKITNNGLVTDVYYDRVMSEELGAYLGDSYTPENNQTYPYININNAGNFLVVRRLREFGTATRYKDFQYQGAVANTKGLGFMGFRILHRTNWYGDGVGILWNSSIHDISKRNAVSRKWVSETRAASPQSPISQADYTYSTSTLSNKVFVNVPTRVISKDLLKGVTTTKNLSYDAYYNPTTISTSNAAGTKSETYTYYNNPTSTSYWYAIGRPTKKIVSSTLNGHTFRSEEEYSYSNTLMSRMRKRGNGTSWVNENYTYDSWGNITRKQLSASGMPNRYEYFTYSTSGRFLISQKDTESLTTQYKTDSRGNVTEVTDPYGRISKYTFDGWDRLTKEIDYLNKTTTFTYQNRSGGGVIKKTNFDQGADTEEHYDVNGLMIQERTLSLNGKWTAISYKYDGAGRQTEISEPYFTTSSATQWNKTVYDRFGRIIEKRSFTGKSTNLSYSGLTTTASDGNKTATTTHDASGNIVRLVDNGGTVTYTYFGNGALREANYGGQKMTVTIDSWGRRTKLVDPSAGTYSYSYNLYGETLLEKTPKGETRYTYDSTGKLTKKTIIGDETDLELNYTYNGDKMLSAIAGQDKKNGRFYNYNYYYDSHKRQNKVIENNDLARFETQLTFDGHGRPLRTSYISKNNTDGTQATVRIRNYYDTYSGMLEEMRQDGSSSALWKLDSHDARGQATKMTFGNGFVRTNTFDTYGLPKTVRTVKSGTSTTALSMNYTFNAQRGILNNRKNNKFNWTENFGHDQLDRLTSISGSTSRTQSYDNRGRITSNSLLGNYSYNSSKAYRLAGIDLNANGQNYFQNNYAQQITYNAFKKPVEVYEEGGGKVSFEYGVLENRSHAWYGGLDNKKTDRRYHKHYSAISPVEIVEDKDSGEIKILTYVGGDAYSAPIAHIKTKNGSINGYHYLHRDYLGSILAITDGSGNIKEQRNFGAWGTMDRYSASAGGSFGASSILQRGFTGHEHFTEVGLIHMNGRMYDAQLGRFLSPDNYVQDPYNTQNFNRYGYVLNNPLINGDPSGEFILAAVIIGALIGGVSAAIAPGANFGDILLGAIIGGVAGAVGAGVSNVFAGGGFLTTTGANIGFTSGFAGGFAGGFLGTTLNAWVAGEKFGAGLFKGFKSGVVSGVVGGLLSGFKANKNGRKFFSGKTKPIKKPDDSILANTNLNSPLKKKPVVYAEGDYYEWTDTAPGPDGNTVFRKGTASVEYTFTVTETSIDWEMTLRMNGQWIGRDLQMLGDGMMIGGYALTLTGVGAEIGAPMFTAGGYISFTGGMIEDAAMYNWTGSAENIGYFLVTKGTKNLLMRVPGTGLSKQILSQNGVLKIKLVRNLIENSN